MKSATKNSLTGRASLGQDRPNIGSAHQADGDDSGSTCSANFETNSLLDTQKDTCALSRQLSRAWRPTMLGKRPSDLNRSSCASRSATSDSFVDHSLFTNTNDSTADVFPKTKFADELSNPLWASHTMKPQFTRTCDEPKIDHKSSQKLDHNHIERRKSSKDQLHKTLRKPRDDFPVEWVDASVPSGRSQLASQYEESTTTARSSPLFVRGRNKPPNASSKISHLADPVRQKLDYDLRSPLDNTDVPPLDSHVRPRMHYSIEGFSSQQNVQDEKVDINHGSDANESFSPTADDQKANLHPRLVPNSRIFQAKDAMPVTVPIGVRRDDSVVVTEDNLDCILDVISDVLDFDDKVSSMHSIQFARESMTDADAT